MCFIFQTQDLSEPNGTQRSMFHAQRPTAQNNVTFDDWYCRCWQKTVQLKWNWKDHVSRMHPKKRAKVATAWVLEDERRRCRPGRPWRDDFDEFEKMCWEIEKDEAVEDFGGNLCLAVGHQVYVVKKILLYCKNCVRYLIMI